MNLDELRGQEVVELSTMEEVSGGYTDPFGRYLFSTDTDPEYTDPFGRYLF